MPLTETLETVARSIVSDDSTDDSSLLDRGWEKVTDAIHSTRDVYFTNRGTVVKFPKQKAFTEVNKNEVKGWQCAENEHMLAPVIDYHEEYLWVEMLRCGRFDYSADWAKNSFNQKLSTWRYQLGDIHPENLGRNPHNMEIVCVDYGAATFYK